jgi:hypothetical protein
MSNPAKEHFQALNKLWSYIYKTYNHGITYNCEGKDLALKGYVDSDWANDINNRKSTSGYLFSLGSIYNINPVSWNSLLQKTVALSSCEAEYMALKEAIKEGIYLNNAFQWLNSALNLGYSTEPPTVLIDNQAAKILSENPEFHKRSKHIDIIYHFNREAVKDNKIKLLYIKSKEQLADILTKYLEKQQYIYLKNNVKISAII